MSNNRSKRKSKTILRFFSLKKSFGFHSFNKLGFVLVLVLLFSYIFQVTEMTREIYAIQGYNNKIKNITEESRKAEYGFLQANSVSRVEELIQESDFVDVEEIYYINILDTQVASR